ncbi:hypothetical protein PS687_02507 [Pseudomonas fluorescens]|jgi:hypothetical protein|nr:hypothetical protein PS687_02507 [Pseudomonas fluorescens]
MIRVDSIWLGQDRLSRSPNKFQAFFFSSA